MPQNAPPIPQNVPPVPQNAPPVPQNAPPVPHNAPPAPAIPSIPPQQSKPSIPAPIPIIPQQHSIPQHTVPQRTPLPESIEESFETPSPSLPTMAPPPLPSSSAPSLPRTKKAAPPPPPPQPAPSGHTSGSGSTSRISSSNYSELDSKQNAGSNLRKISALDYTINPRNGTGNTHGADSKAEKLVIEDRRFKFVNANALPNPRRFGEKGQTQKLYPSGRGSSVPLDLSLFS